MGLIGSYPLYCLQNRSFTYSIKSMLAKYLKNTNLWIKISHTDVYQRFIHPNEFNKQVKEYNFYKNLLSEYPTGNSELIMDVGASIGMKSRIFSKLAKKVLAFEPSMRIFSILKDNFRNSNVEVINCALGKESATLDYYEIENDTAYSSLSKKHIETTVKERNIADLRSVKIKKVSVERIETFIRKYGVPIYIKIDVEGYEFEVIQGLETAVPLVSFEANLPEFCEESIKIIDHLSLISADKYHYNFTTDNNFLLKDFTEKNDAIKFLKSTQLRYLEIYARLRE